jgi:hypothetical protein
MYDDAAFDEFSCEEFYGDDPREILRECAEAEAEGDEKPL